MPIAITDFLRPLDKNAVLTDLYGFAQSLGLTTTAWQPGEPVPVVLDVVTSWVVGKLWNPVIVPALRGPFLDYSSGFWLALEAWSRYFRPKLEPQSSTGPIVVEGRGSYFGTIAPGQFRVKNGVTGATYTNTTSGAMTAWTGSGPYPTVTMTFQADMAGSGSNAQPGDIPGYPTAPVASPGANLFQQANAGAFLGSDGEQDDRLVTRCRAAAAELSSSGPRAAYEGIALDPLGAFTRRGFPVPSGWSSVPPAITRVRVVDTGGATATVYLASDSGPAAGNSSTPGTDVYKAAAALQLFAKSVGVTLTVAPATPNDIAVGTITLTLDAAANVTATDAVAGAMQALAFFFSRLQIGGNRKTGGGTGYLFKEEIQRAAGSWPQSLPDGSGGVYYPKIPGLVAVDLTLSDTALGAGDVVIASYTVQANVVDQS